MQVNIQVNIPDSKVEQFRAAFLRECPNPNVNISDNKWIKIKLATCVEDFMRTSYHNGRLRLAEEELDTESDILTGD